MSIPLQDGHIPLMRKDSSLSNDVFESVDSDDFSHPETVPEETSSQLVTPTSEHPSRQVQSVSKVSVLQHGRTKLHVNPALILLSFLAKIHALLM